MIRAIRVTTQALAIPLGLSILVVGYLRLSYWWVVLVATVTAVGFADQTLGDDSPLAFNECIPGPRYKDVIAGLFAFAGSLAGFSVMYLIGLSFG